MCSVVHGIVLYLVSLYIIKAAAVGHGPIVDGNGGSEASSVSDDESEQRRTEGSGGSGSPRTGAFQVAGKLYDSVHGKASEGQPRVGLRQRLREVLQTYQQKAFMAAGNMYGKANPIRLYWGKSWRVMNQLSLDKLSRKEQLNSIMSALTEEITDLLPDSADLQPIEVHSPFFNYICGADGFASNFKSVKHVNTKTETSNDIVTIRITYRLENLLLTYNTFYMKMVKAIRLRGKLIIKYKESEVTIILRIPRISKLIVNVVRKDCIMHVTGFEVASLEYEDCDIETGNRINRRQALLALRPYVRSSENQFKTDFETTVLTEVHRALATTGEWICKDAAVAEDVAKRGGTLEDYKPSKKFRRKCLGEKHTNWFGYL